MGISMFERVVALYGVPRSGTSWLGQIIDSSPDVVFRFQPLFSYRFKNRILAEATREDIQGFFEELYRENNDDFLNQADKRESGRYPCFQKSEDSCNILTYKEVRYLYTVPILLERYDNIKIIAIVRNPYDVLESWINAPSEYKAEWDLSKEWMFGQSKNEYKPENYYGYYKWKEWIKMVADYREKYPDRLFAVQYEELNENAVTTAKALFSFMDLPFTRQTEQFILDSQSKTDADAYSVYKKKGDNRNKKHSLPEDIRGAIREDLKSFDEAHIWGYGVSSF